MNPAYGLFGWVIMGTVAGWIGSRIIGTAAHERANVVLGVVGAVMGGFVTRAIFGEAMGTAGLLGGFAAALLGASLVIFVGTRFSGPAPPAPGRQFLSITSARRFPAGTQVFPPSALLNSRRPRTVA
jgi:uncharacterized membrane protein YeaQ/YmgE (transglycosylase-associated protein family)